MHINKSTTDGFDDMLKGSLQNHIVSVPSDFAQRLLTRIQRQEYATALAAIKTQERWLLATMILLPIAVAAGAILLPHQIMTMLSASIADARQLFFFYAAKADLLLRYWMEIAVISTILIYVFFDFVLGENRAL
jgi:hypothetical protein